MKTTSSRRPRHWRGKTAVTLFVAAVAFAGGEQVLAPAPAAALRTDDNCVMTDFGQICDTTGDDKGSGGGGYDGGDGGAGGPAGTFPGSTGGDEWWDDSWGDDSGGTTPGTTPDSGEIWVQDPDGPGGTVYPTLEDGVNSAEAGSSGKYHQRSSRKGSHSARNSRSKRAGARR